MKLQLTALFIVLTGLAQADVGIYRGHQVAKTAGPAPRVTQPEKVIQVVDWDTSEVVLIRFGVKNMKKTFTVSEATAVVVTEVGEGKSSNRMGTVLAQASTEVDAETGDTTVMSMLQTGFNVVVPGNQAVPSTRPRLLKLTAFRLDEDAATPAGPDDSTLVQVSGAFHLLTAQTVESNTAGESLADAVLRVVAGLVADGNEDQTVYPVVEVVQ